MNITDIDDKIIKRARQNHLFRMYSAEVAHISLDQLIADQDEILKALKETCAKNADPDKKPMLEKMMKCLLDVKTKTELAKGQETQALALAKEAFLAEARDSIADWLDKRDGHTVNGNEIFEELPKYWESKFHEDMSALNVSVTENFPVTIKQFI